MKSEGHFNNDTKIFKPGGSHEWPSDQSKEKQQKDKEGNCNVSTNYDDQSICERTSYVEEKGGYSYIFTIIYFFTSISMVFLLMVFNIISEYFFSKKPNVNIAKHLPEFYSLKTIQPTFFSLSVLIISVSGLFNVWHFCSMLLQRFSVPELSKYKITIHFMFIFGSFSHFIFIFFGFSPAIIAIQTMKLKFIEFSLTMVIFIVFIFFNILFAILAWMVIEKLRAQNIQTSETLKGSVRMKMYVIGLAVITLCFYIFAIISHNGVNQESLSDKVNNQWYCMIKLAIFILPYLLYVINAFLNLTYYSDILKIQAHLNVFLDKDYFIISNDETALLI